MTPSMTSGVAWLAENPVPPRPRPRPRPASGGGVSPTGAPGGVAAGPAARPSGAAGLMWYTHATLRPSTLAGVISVSGEKRVALAS